MPSGFNHLTITAKSFISEDGAVLNKETSEKLDFFVSNGKSLYVHIDFGDIKYTVLFSLLNNTHAEPIYWATVYGANYLVTRRSDGFWTVDL